MLQYEVNKRIPPRELAYSVHSTISSMRKIVPPSYLPTNSQPVLVQNRPLSRQIIVGQRPQSASKKQYS